jgi:DNA-binding GntR family transcriptional regulator
MKLGRSSHASRVAALLRESIIDGSLPVDAHLREAQIAEQMGISRGPVRIALQALEGEGLLRTLPNGRMVVAGFDLDGLDDLLETRSALETRAIRRGISRGSDLTDLREATAAIEVARSIPRIVDLDVHYHRQLVAFGGSRFLMQVWLPLAPVIHAVILIGTRTLVARESMFTRIVDSHRDLTDAVANGKADEAVRLLEAQFEMTKSMFTRSSADGEAAARSRAGSAGAGAAGRRPRRKG